MSEVTELFPPHPAQAALGVLAGAVGDLAECNLWSMGEGDLLDLRVRLEQVRARLEAAVLATTREVDARGAATATGASSTAAWLRHRLRLHPAAAKAEVALAADLAGDRSETGAALAAGAVTRDQAAAIAAAVRHLPPAVPPELVRKAEGYLLDQADQLDPAALQTVGRHLLQALDPEHGAALERDEATHQARRSFTLTHHPDGSRRLHGQLAPDTGALLDAAIAVHAAPAPADDGTPDPRSPAQRRADALIELVTQALGGDSTPQHGGEPVTLTVTTTADYLRTERAERAKPGPGPAATLDDGSPLSPESTRRLGCDAWLVAALLDSSGDVLDIGRASRVIPRSMRRALTLRDRGCAFPGCGRPARWCHGHHIWHWSAGGPTALSNLVLLCGDHHRAVHHDGWQVQIEPDGHPWFTPPPWIDPYQRPRPPWRPPTLQRE